jgi:hypothetical protein
MAPRYLSRPVARLIDATFFAVTDFRIIFQCRNQMPSRGHLVLVIFDIALFRNSVA